MRCIVSTCHHDSSTAPRGVSFHSFPSEPSLRDSWLQSLGKEGWVPSEASVVCSDHFEKGDLYVNRRGQRSLRADALPNFTLEVCRMCLATGGQLMPLRERRGLQQAYYTLTGQTPESGDGLPQQLCATCARLLLSHRRLRARALRAHAALSSLARDRHQITFKVLQSMKGYVNEYCSNLKIKHYKPDHCDFEIKHVEDDNVRTDQPNLDVDRIMQDIKPPITVKVENELNLIGENCQSNFEGSNVKLENDCLPRAEDSEILEEHNESSTEHSDVVVENNCTPSVQDTAIKLENGSAPSLNESKPKIDCVPNFEPADSSLNIENSHKDCIEVENCAPFLEDCDVIKPKIVNNNKLKRVVTKKDILGAIAAEVENMIIQQKLIDEDASSSRDARRNSPVTMDSDVEEVGDSNTSLGVQDVPGHWWSAAGAAGAAAGVPHTRRPGNAERKKAPTPDRPPKETYKCSSCKKTFLRHITWLQHTKGPCPYTCSPCRKSFRSKQGYNCHLETQAHKRSIGIKNTSKEKFTCEICKRVFNKINTFNYHMNTCYGTNTRLYCKICKMVFFNQKDLDIHHNVHNLSQFTCDVCGKPFFNKRILIWHLRHHSMEKLYSCDECQMRFFNIDGYKCHMSVHAGAPYACSVCAKRFRDNVTYRRHMKNHESMKPYTCNLCTKMFGDKSLYQVHMKRHAESKIYICDVCKTSFDAQRALIKHLETLCDSRR